MLFGRVPKSAKSSAKSSKSCEPYFQKCWRKSNQIMNKNLLQFTILMPLRPTIPHNMVKSNFSFNSKKSNLFCLCGPNISLVCCILCKSCPETCCKGLKNGQFLDFPDILTPAVSHLHAVLASKLKLKLTLSSDLCREIVPNSKTNKLQKLVWKLLKTRYPTQSNNLAANSMSYFHNFVLISLKVTMISVEKLPSWYNKLVVLITTILNPIVSFKSEEDSNENSFKSSLHDSDNNL